MMRGQRTRAALISIASNAALIVLKLIAGVITGSVAIVTEAIHSAVDLVASFIAYFSVRQAEEPADADHPHGHEKFENVAAAAEGVLILIGSGVIIYAAIRSLVVGPELEVARRGHRRAGLLDRRQPRRLHVAVPARARDATPPRWRATPPTCAPTPTPRPACSSASCWCRSPAPSGSTRSWRS